MTYCLSCDGSGEGDRDGTKCRWCLGTGSEEKAREQLAAEYQHRITPDVIEQLFGGAVQAKPGDPIACPFCGDNATAKESSSSGQFVLCITCGARGPCVRDYVSVALARTASIILWNTRNTGAKPDELDAL